MGLFNRGARAPEPDPMGEAVREAFKLGYVEGRRDGQIIAFEAFASSLDNALTSLPDEHPARSFLQSVRRSSKQIAAEIAGQS